MTHFLSPSSARISHKCKRGKRSSWLSEYESTLEKFYTSSSNAVRKRAIDALAEYDQSAKSSLSSPSTPRPPLPGGFWPSYSTFTHSLTSFRDWAPRLFDESSWDISLPKEYRTNDKRIDEILERFVERGKGAKTREEREEVIWEVGNFWPAEKSRSTASNFDMGVSQGSRTKEGSRLQSKLHKARTLWGILT
ncbi:hypothetical protein I302_106496 [Kwoniella bestiolae CBS 10118]|uniref:Uncharacterized protein n=1 Tax=Kwoniella bestiolae CBS 10118 TaxID=1296100 RepID=A0A1B9G195_9TREE|nr:hypothetical protein I302_06246 [Kwoniella bestiolae CBS 10118]OCF24785.1 hypothetical protein I302_06246 [Kwoniella bestiolae CBS 10118]